MSDWFERAKQLVKSGSIGRCGPKGCGRAALARRLVGFESLEPRLTLSIAPGMVPVGSQPAGALSGKFVFTSGGHGWQWNSTLARYATDRGDNNEIVEDFGNQEQMTAYADYLLRAGATVVPMRPVGRQTNEVVVDNDSTSTTFSGAWSNSSSTKYYDEDYGAVADAIPYRFASTVTGSPTATATYTPNIPQAGFYPVYTWVLWGSDRTVQTYQVNHTGGTTEIKVDHGKVGSGWVYLGTYHFNSGSSSTMGSVQITNKSTTAGKVVIADAIRFGNGMGDYIGSGASAISGYPREDENSLHWIARMTGVGTTLATAIGSGTSNVSAPSNMAQYMFHGTFGETVYVGFHSNAGGGRGARGLIDADAADNTPHQADLALFLGRQINQDMQNLAGVFEYNWSTGSTHTYTGQFGELDLGTSAEMDATIIEVAFHDSVEDAAIMRDPLGRDQIARSVYQGTLEYFAAYGTPVAANTSLPTAPTNLRVVSNASGAVTVSWAAGASTPASVHGAAPTGFRVYASIDGYGFDGGTLVNGAATTSVTLSGYDPTKPYYFRVAAVNAGGESKPSEVLAVLPSGGVKQVLIVNGFDRLDRVQDFRYAYAYTGDGLVDRVWSRYNNSFDYIVQVETAIQAAKPGVHVASTSNEAVISGAVNLLDYDTVIWISGNESTDDDSFNATEQAKLTTFINTGGNVFVSGSEIGWDLDQQYNGRTFYESTLRANFVNDDAGTYAATADAAGIFAGMSSLTFSNGASFSQLDWQMYNVAYPDVIAPLSGAVSALSYSGGVGGSAAIQYTGSGGQGNLVVFGFPFETITNAARRQTAMDRILTYFGVAAPAPGVAIETQIEELNADVPTGPVLATGATAVFTYRVTNTGNVPLTNITISDDNGTPGDLADDFTPTYGLGDLNGNGQLDVGETWIYRAGRSVGVGQYTSNTTITAIGNAQTVTSSDPVNYFGSAPAVAVKTLVNGEDADTGPGPILTAGSTVTFAYLVTNTGNVSLSGVLLTDNNGTPGNTADDFAPTLFGGDTNSNGQLDIGELWGYSAMRTVIAGPFTNSAVVAASDSIAQVVSSSDSGNYFGVVPANADFNGDAAIDAADFVVWRKNNGVTSGATQSQGDASGDGAVNAFDYDLWRSLFGVSLSPAASASGLAIAAGAAFTRSTAAGVAEALSENNAAPAPSRYFDAAFAGYELLTPADPLRPIRSARAAMASSGAPQREAGALLAVLNGRRNAENQDRHSIDKVCGSSESTPADECEDPSGLQARKTAESVARVG